MVKLHSDRRVPAGNEDSELIIVRNAKFSDVKQLIGIYLNLSSQDRRWFHPFPFKRSALHTIFYAMICLKKFIPITKMLHPKLVSIILVAENSASGQIVGFTYLRGKSRERNGLIVNRGIVAVSGTRSKGISRRMDSQLICIAKVIGVHKFSVTVLKDNVASISFHEKMGYICKGYAEDDYWNNKRETNLMWELELKKAL